MNRYQMPIALSLLALTAMSLHAAGELQVRQFGNVAYVSGGVSEEARDSLQALASGFRVKLVLATKSGAYLSDVAIAVDDAAGKRVLEAKSDGPWFFAMLPPGRYQIAASANGATVRKAVNVGAQGLRTVDYRWDD